MTTNNIQDQFTKIKKLATTSQLTKALLLLQEQINNNSLSQFNYQFQQITQTYKYFLQYNAEGIEDPQQQTIYTQTIQDFLQLTNQIQTNLQLANTTFSTPDVHQQKEQALKFNFNDTEIHLQLLQNPENTNSTSTQIVEKLFFAMIFNQQFQKKHIQIWHNYFIETQNTEHQSTLVSAISLSLFQNFNIHKFQLLSNIAQNAQSPIWQRALIGLFFTFNIHPYITKIYPETIKTFKQATQPQTHQQALQNIINQYIKLLETETIAQKLKDEILPEVAKITPKITEKLDLDKLVQDDFSEDTNPDWQDIFGESQDLINKMGELSQMQLEGSDVFMSTFAQLKHMPFFQYITNWFIPYTANSPWITENQAINNELKNKPTITQTLEIVPFMCNSDKFSFILNIPMLPEAQKKMMLNYFMSDIESMNEIADEDKKTQPNQADKYIITQYLQDLYRFFKLNINKTHFTDIFNTELPFLETPLFFEAIQSDNNKLMAIAEAFFSKKRFASAIKIYQTAIKQEINEYTVYQKLAFSYQKLKQYQKALDYYLKAELFDQNKIWNLKKIGYCYMQLKQPQKALEYYLPVEKEEPENLQIQAQIGKAYVELEQFETALNYFYKLEYLNPNNQKVWRPLAWCMLHANKTKSATKYLQKISATSTQAFDFINLGHALLIQKENKKAIQQYQKAIDLTTDYQEFENEFKLNKSILQKNNITNNQINLILQYLEFNQNQTLNNPQ